MEIVELVSKLTLRWHDLKSKKKIVDDFSILEFDSGSFSLFRFFSKMKHNDQIEQTVKLLELHML